MADSETQHGSGAVHNGSSPSNNDGENVAPSAITPNTKEEKQEEKEEHPGILAEAKEKFGDKKQEIKDKTDPPGGYDDTPIPKARDGFTVKFTVHRANNLPIADFKDLSADPFVHATLKSALQKRHKEDPDLTVRMKTLHKTTNPAWEQEWIVAGIPSSGFTLKCRLYDEDPSDHDDRLGNVTVTVDHLNENWEGFREKEFDIKKRMGSKRAYAVRGCASLCNSEVHMSGTLVLSAEVLGKTEEGLGRMYTVGPLNWIKHYSPMIGRLVGIKAPEDQTNEEGKIQKYDFQANELQLQGPVPEHLYHRFVEFRPFVKGMFSKAGLRGRILNKALHHQHARIYNFSPTTEYGQMKPRTEEAALQFLKMAHYDEGGRIFTYVLTLDGLLRFTETGKEFGVDLLSKHTMHSDVSIYIACSGEFFIRRLKHPNQSVDAPEQETHPSTDLPGGPPNAPPPEDPKDYELVIDNDSGTYRPKAEFLPELKKFLNANFPGMHIKTYACDDEKLTKMKDEQRERKKKEGQNIHVMQNSDDEISSSDEEELDKRVNNKKTAKQRALDALEDPSAAAKDLLPGHASKHTATNGDAGPSST